MFRGTKDAADKPAKSTHAAGGGLWRIRESRTQRSQPQQESKAAIQDHPSSSATSVIPSPKAIDYDQVAVNHINKVKKHHDHLLSTLPRSPRPNFPITPRVQAELQMATYISSHTLGSNKQRPKVWPTPRPEDSSSSLIPNRPPSTNTGGRLFFGMLYCGVCMKGKG